MVPLDDYEDLRREHEQLLKVLAQLRKAGGRTKESASVRVGGGYQRLGDYLQRMTEGLPGATGVLSQSTFTTWLDESSERQRQQLKPSLAACLDGGIEPPVTPVTPAFETSLIEAPALYPLRGRASEQQRQWEQLSIRAESRTADGGRKVTDRYDDELPTGRRISDQHFEVRHLSRPFSSLELVSRRSTTTLALTQAPSF